MRISDWSSDVCSSDLRLIHRGLGPARLDLSAGDRFGKTVQPREWFFAPLSIISELISRIRAGTITQYVYNPVKAEFVAQDRSEEHTSDLQSLMRNSYAVFFL